MHFVDDIGTQTESGGGVIDLLPDLSDVVHAVVGSGVDFRYIHGRIFQHGPAVFTLVAGIAVHRGKTVGRPGQNFGAGGLAGAPGAGEEIGMGQPPGLDLGLEGGGDVLLAHHIVKGDGSPFAIKGLMRHESSLPRKQKHKRKNKKQRRLPRLHTASSKTPFARNPYARLKTGWPRHTGCAA